MNDNNNNNRSFIETLVKCYIIWKIVCFVAKAFIFCIKLCYNVLKKIIKGVIKISPIIKENYISFKYNYETRYRYEINDKFKSAFLPLKRLKEKIKDSISKMKLRRQEVKSIKKMEIKMIEKQEKKLSKDRKYKPILCIKKIKYTVIDFIYKYEIHIAVLVTIGIIVAGIIIGFNFWI